VRIIELTDIIMIVLTIWGNSIATIALIHALRKDKRKTAPRHKPKHMRKR